MTSYIVSIYDTTGHMWKAIATKVKKLEYKVTNLQPSTTYEFRIAAVNKVGPGQTTRTTVRATTKASRGVVPTTHKGMCTIILILYNSFNCIAELRVEKGYGI